MEIQWKEYCEEGKVVVLSKVRHSYAASKSLLKPWVIIRTNGTVEVAHCTCMAGLAETCSHIGEILHWVDTASHIRNDTPCTSLEDKWLMSAFVQDMVPSFTCILGPSSKIEAPSPNEIETFSPYDWGRKQNKYFELKKTSKIQLQGTLRKQRKISN